MALSTLTVTGKIGPGFTLTSQVFNNVKSFCFNDQEVLQINYEDKTAYIDISAAVTLTLTVSGSAYTLTIANS